MSLPGVRPAIFLAVIVTFAACSNGPSSFSNSSVRTIPAVLESRASIALPRWAGPVVYAAPTERGVVNVYRGGTTKPGSPIYSFQLDPGTANSLMIDRASNVYLADTYSTWVLKYAPGTPQPSERFQTPQSPFNIALRGDTLYAFQSMPSGGRAGVAVFANGGTKISATLTDPAIYSPSGLAVDASGNVFVGYNGSGLTSGIGEFVGGRMPMKHLNLHIDPLSLAIDTQGNLLIDTYTGAAQGTSTIDIFPPEKLEPARRITDLPWLYQLSLTADGKYFYAGPMNGKSFKMYAFPSGKLIYSKDESDAISGFAGIAASPAARLGTW